MSGIAITLEDARDGSKAVHAGCRMGFDPTGAAVTVIASAMRSMGEEPMDGPATMTKRHPVNWAYLTAIVPPPARTRRTGPKMEAADAATALADVFACDPDALWSACPAILAQYKRNVDSHTFFVANVAKEPCEPLSPAQQAVAIEILARTKPNAMNEIGSHHPRCVDAGFQLTDLRSATMRAAMRMRSPEALERTTALMERLGREDLAREIAHSVARD